jgi:protein PhnA
MSTGYQSKFQRPNQLARLAKDLVRRSRSKCELCDLSGSRLQVYELLPLPEEPTVEGCVFICDACLKQLTHPKKMIPSHWRCLNNALWSEVPAVQALSFRILKRLVALDQHWAEELLEHAYLDPDVEDWARAVE